MGKHQKRQVKKLPQPVVEVAQETTVPLFVEDTVGGFKGVPKSLRDNALVMDKTGKVPFSKGEENIVKKLALKKPTPPSKTPVNRKSQLTDLWASDAPSKRRMKPLIGNFESLAVPAVKLPHAGQSVNPEISSYEALVDQLATQEISDPKPSKPEIASLFARDAEKKPEISSVEISASAKKYALRKTTADRNREERHRKLLEEHGKIRSEKKISAQINHLPALLKEVSKTEQQHLLEAEKIEKFRSERIRQIAQGRVARRGAGGIFREAPEALARRSEEGSLRRVSAGASNPISECMRGIFRRRLLEQPAVLDADYANKLKHRNVQKGKRKFHDSLARDIALLR